MFAIVRNLHTGTQGYLVYSSFEECRIKEGGSCSDNWTTIERHEDLEMAKAALSKYDPEDGSYNNKVDGGKFCFVGYAIVEVGKRLRAPIEKIGYWEFSCFDERKAE